MIKNFLYFIGILYLFVGSFEAYCEVIFDGTMNPETVNKTLSGKFSIEASYGKQKGKNLFHSFKKFNLSQDEVAIFSGENINNIISRVTGGEKSIINGTIKSKIDNANLIFINPSGVMFNEHAKVDIKGSLHITTANFILLDNGEKFYAESNNPVFFDSDPRIFGFFDQNNSSIETYENDHEQINHQIEIELKVNQTISFISNEININSSRIVIPNGHINFASIKCSNSDAFITLTEKGFNISKDTKFGNINISNSQIRVDGSEYLSLFGGNIRINNSKIIGRPGDVESCDIEMFAEDFSMINSTIDNHTYNDISCGHIKIVSKNNVHLIESNIISENPYDFSKGNAGNILIDANNIILENKSELSTKTNSITGKGGDISLHAENSVLIYGINDGYVSSLFTYSKSKGKGNGGDITILTKNLSIRDGGYISADTYCTGNAGDIYIQAKDGYVEVIGFNPMGKNIYGFESNISSQQKNSNPNSGRSGNIDINTDKLIIKDGASISNSTFGDGESGNIDIIANHINISGYAIKNTNHTFETYFSGIYSSSNIQNYCEKPGGKINISSSNLIINNYGTINTSSTGKRNAGDIFLNISDKLKLNNQASINSESLDIENGGAAGRITINSSGDISLFNDSCITTEAKATSASNIINDNGKISISSDSLYLNNSKITSSVKSGAEDGGNIDINHKMLVLNNSKISANAYEGKGGNIQIIANNFVKSQNSIIEASSEKGIDGNIYIDAPEENSNDDILVLSDNFLDASAWIQNECEKKLNNNVSRLIFLKQTASPIDLNDWISPPLIMSNNDKTRYNCNEIASGFQFFQRGLFGKAIKEWKKSLICLDNYSTDYLNVMIYLSFCYKALGRNTEAFSILNDIHNDIIKNNNNRLKSLYLMNLGDFYLTADKKSLALKNFEDALEISKTVSPVFYAYNLIYLGNILSIDQKYSKAISLYLEAVNTTAKSHKEENEDNIVNTIAYLNIAQICFVHGKYKNADKALEISLKHLNTLDDNYFKAKTLISCSLFKLKIAQSNDTDNKTINMAYEILNKVRHIGSQIENYKILSITTGYMGHIHEIFKDYSKSINLTKKAIFYCQQIDSPENLFIWQWQAGRIFKAKGDTLKAIKKYKDSIATLSFIRLQLLKTYGDNKKLFYDKVRSLHLELADIFLKQADLSLDSQTNILIKARDTIDLLKHWELQNYYQDECLNYNSNKNTNDEKITIDKNIAILYPIVFSDRVVLLITYSDELKQITCNLKNNNLLNLIERLNKKLRDVRLESRFMYYCKKLYNLLIKPIEKELENRNINTLIIASDSCLRLIPFAVLHDGKSFLFEKYALASIPGINLTNLKRNNNVNKNILLNGLAKYADPPLPGVSKELSAIKNKYKNSTLLLDKNFTLKNLTQELIHNNYSHVVIATHGVFNGSPENTYLQAFNEKISINDLERLISKLKSQTVDLLTLSACETAADDEKAALGLAGIAVKSGVKSAVATLWPVDDNASFILIKEFYNIIQNSNNSKAKALQKAQKKLFAKSEYKHPFYWSPFILIGNWL